jgi:hypothetical protein
MDKNNIIKTEKIEYKYIDNGSNNNGIDIKNNYLINDEFRVSNVYGDLIYISGGILSNNNNNKKILNNYFNYDRRTKGIIKRKIKTIIR